MSTHAELQQLFDFSINMLVETLAAHPNVWIINHELAGKLPPDGPTNIGLAQIGDKFSVQLQARGIQVDRKGGSDYLFRYVPPVVEPKSDAEIVVEVLKNHHPNNIWLRDLSRMTGLSVSVLRSLSEERITLEDNKIGVRKVEGDNVEFSYLGDDIERPTPPEPQTVTHVTGKPPKIDETIGTGVDDVRKAWEQLELAAADAQGVTIHWGFDELQRDAKHANIEILAAIRTLVRAYRK
jgi:hypothetical protein